MKCNKGTILTVDAANSVYSYLVEDNGRIIYTGNELPQEYKNAEVVNLGGKVLAPAFVGTHQHFASRSTFNAGLNVMEAESNEEIDAVCLGKEVMVVKYDGAYTTFDEKERGSLEAGKVAYMVILSENPYAVPSESIKDIKVEGLILSGRPYESARTSLLSCIWKGITSHAKY